MSDKDPFAEPDDADRTIIRPNPGGRRPSAAAPQPAATPEPNYPGMPQPSGGAQQPMGIPSATPGARHGSAAEPNVEQGMTGMNRINAAAATLFSLVSRIRNRAQHMDPDKLRRSVVAEVREFENRAMQQGVDAQDVKIARYAICATLDDVVLNTPWGGQSIWAQQSMVGTFHKETVGGDRFYDLLARLEKEPGNNIDLLEFLYMCLSLGFEGRLRVEDNGTDKHMQIRAGLARIIRGQRGTIEKDLSPHWKGVEEPHKVLSVWRPLWITTATVAVILTGVFLSLSWMLNRSTDRVIGQLSVLDTGQVAELMRRAPPPPPPPPPPDVQLKRVQGFLEEEIERGIVEVFQDQATITVRLAGSGMFGSGSDRLQQSFIPPLDKVANALNDTNGPIIVVGHSDNVPIRSSRFPSNDHLSLARAEAVMRKLADRVNDGKRLAAEGRADREPIADNGTRDGRAKNRRIEIVLVRDDTA
ncbi:type IVB secretion system protein IcmH/DotU [Tateyamaria sp. ANG-S1]|uniref:type IVB secretion system protein IcmH/DotU n=1 Tax=Tateyamaria sp. ANG-S1 TaxID=1577905 RepID=UPI00057C8B5F|nr:type IVB secretion system protein IcmH/DotU [Tateyamaria sp. ANG-S1]KIC47738.1 membrane protein [Tateyamaria sp. ANG-S1]